MAHLNTEPPIFDQHEESNDAEDECAETVEKNLCAIGDNGHNGKGIDNAIKEEQNEIDLLCASADGVFICKECGEEFEVESKLQAHVMLHGEDKVYKCQFCNKLFSKNSNLTSHLRIYTGEKPFHCKICSKTFAWMHSVRIHVPSVHKVGIELIESFIGNDYAKEECSADGSQVNYGEDLDVSVNVGDKKKRLEGGAVLDAEDNNENKCNTEYKDMENYLIKTHISKSKSKSKGSNDDLRFFEKRKVTFICKHCSKEVNQKSNMIDHVRSHLGVKRFKCRLCGKDLSRKQNIVHHLKYVHFVDNSSVNDMIIVNDEAITPKSEVYEQDLDIAKAESMDLGVVKIEDDELDETKNIDRVIKDDMHFKDNTSDIQQTSDKNLSNENDLDTVSIKNEEFEEGKVCDKVVEDDVDTDVEEPTYEVIEGDTAAEKRYLCKICGFTCDRRYYMKNQHIMKHTGAKRYRCVICCKAYTRKFVFRRHVMKEHNIGNEELDSIFDASEIDKMKKQPTRTSSVSDTKGENQPDLAVTTEASVIFDIKKSYFDKHRNFGSNDKSFDIDPDERTEINEEYPKAELDFSFSTIPVDNPNKFIYKCNICGFVCTRKYYMENMHNLKHSGGKPYVCVVCCKLYSRRYVLRKHLVIKHGIKGEELEELLKTTGKRLLNSGDGLPVATAHSNIDADLSSGSDSNFKLRMGESSSIGSDIEALQGIDGGKSEEETSGEVLESRKKCLPIQVNKEKNSNETGNINLKFNREEVVMTAPIRTVCETDLTDNDNELDSELETSVQDGDNVKSVSQRNNKKSKWCLNDKTEEEMIKTSKSETDQTDSDDDIANGRQSKRARKYEHSLEHIMRSLMDLKTLTCLKCNKKCSKKSNLKQHIRILHFNLKEYVCQECNKTFNTNYNLKVHMKQHLQPEDRDLMSHECYICKKAFTTRSYLKVHLKRYHSDKLDNI